MTVSNETRTMIEEQFAECNTFEETAVLYSDFNKVIDKALRDKNEFLINELE